MWKTGVARRKPITVGPAPLDYQRELPEAPHRCPVAPGREQEEPLPLLESQLMQHLMDCRTPPETTRP